MSTESLDDRLARIKRGAMVVEDVHWLVAQVEILSERNDRQAATVDKALLVAERLVQAEREIERLHEDWEEVVELRGRVTVMRQNRDHWRRRAAALGDEDALASQVPPGGADK